MTQETIYQKIVSIIQERQGKSFEVTPELSFKDNLGADSVDMMEFILTLEDEFGIDILDEDIDRLCSVADVVAYIEKKTKQALPYFFLCFNREDIFYKKSREAGRKNTDTACKY